jgi:predicted HicB family RNase H-like nuclease
MKVVDILTYKGFIGSVHFSDEDDVFFGKVEEAVSKAPFRHCERSEAIQAAGHYTQRPAA